MAARRARTTPGSSHPTLQRQTAPRRYAHGTSRGRSCCPPEGQRRGDASVSARQTGAQAGAVTLTLDRPRVVIGTLTLQNDLPALQSQTIKLINRLHGDDFDRALTTKSVIASVDDLYRNAGYLDVATSAPTNSAPRKDLNDYAVDLTAAVTPNVLYRVTAITIHAAPPVSEAELQQGR